ncbi:Uncharacterised protein [Pseudomonas aeruginosa]|nr:Uncharacterised protein [Pseudomonas aeruginosa]
MPPAPADGHELLDGQLHPAGIEVADQQLGADRRQLLGQCVTDVAEPLHRDPQAFQVVAAEARLGAGANPANTPRAVCGEGSPAWVVLVTWRVCWAMQSMSALEVPLSTAVM